ncbi:piggyBac transposable element-derived protein 2-like [Littorina saxatilis]|uniref:piggyBac transposable element-derived protein 2-like n=1 Tax=Littorina saxatilis TaxID=31220 RepID=UPI0038B5E623
MTTSQRTFNVHEVISMLEPYQGARGRQTEYPGLGMGGSVVIDLIAEMQEDQSFHLTFDNLFTSLKLVDCLSAKQIACTGTIRCNRIEDCPVKSINEMKKTRRGTYDYATDVNSGLLVVRWNDNNIVNVVSNKVGIHPVQTARPWSRSEKKKVDVPQPFLIRHYN